MKDLRAIQSTDDEGQSRTVVMGRSGEIKIIDPKSKKVLMSNHVPYSATLKVKEGEKVEKDQGIMFLGSI